MGFTRGLERSVRINLKASKTRTETERDKLAQQWELHGVTTAHMCVFIDRVDVNEQLLVVKLVDELSARQLRRTSAFNQMEVSETGQF